jgi:hypothetical protein
MADDQEFQDSTSMFALLVAVLVTLALPLLPMLMGWFTLLR